MRSALAAFLATGRAAIRKDLAGEAAKMAFYFFLALFPFVVTVFAVTGIVGGDGAFDTLLATAQRAMPPQAWPVVRDLVAEITQRERPGLLSFGVLLTMWAASNAVAALTLALNTIYAVPEPRSWWRRRLLALAVLGAGLCLIVIGTAIVVPTDRWLLSIGVGRVWAVARWPVGATLVTGAIWLAYQYLPARNQRPAARETLSGAAVAMVLWLVTAVAFRFYLERFASYGASYGSLGSVIVILLWFYLDALVVLLGAQLAATLEQQRSFAPAPGR